MNLINGLSVFAPFPCRIMISQYLSFTYRFTFTLASYLYIRM